MVQVLFCLVAAVSQQNSESIERILPADRTAIEELCIRRLVSLAPKPSSDYRINLNEVYDPKGEAYVRLFPRLKDIGKPVHASPDALGGNEGSINLFVGLGDGIDASHVFVTANVQGYSSDKFGPSTIRAIVEKRQARWAFSKRAFTGGPARAILRGLLDVLRRDWGSTPVYVGDCTTPGDFEDAAGDAPLDIIAYLKKRRVRAAPLSRQPAEPWPSSFISVKLSYVNRLSSASAYLVATVEYYNPKNREEIGSWTGTSTAYLATKEGSKWRYHERFSWFWPI